LLNIRFPFFSSLRSVQDTDTQVFTLCLWNLGGIGKAEGFADGERAEPSASCTCRCHPALLIRHFSINSTKRHHFLSCQMSAVRASSLGIGGRGALGIGSYQKVAVDQSSWISARPFCQAICWIVMRASFFQ